MLEGALDGGGGRAESRAKRLDGALDGYAAKEGGIGASLDGKLERGCRLVGAGVDGEKILERELEPGECFYR